MRRHVIGYSVRSQMVDQILEHVHHVGRDVVEGNGRITAAANALAKKSKVSVFHSQRRQGSLSLSIQTYLLHRIVNVVPVPETFVHMTRDNMMLRDEGKESSSTERVAWIACFHAERLETQSHVHVLRATIADALALLRVVRIDALLDEQAESGTTQYVACTTAHVALLDVGLEGNKKKTRYGSTILEAMNSPWTCTQNRWAPTNFD